MHQFQKRFNRSADLLTCVKNSVAAEKNRLIAALTAYSKNGSLSKHSPKPLLYCGGGDSLLADVLCLLLVCFAATDFRFEVLG
jgi:hypothetical protein